MKFLINNTKVNNELDIVLTKDNAGNFLFLNQLVWRLLVYDDNWIYEFMVPINEGVLQNWVYHEKGIKFFKAFLIRQETKDMLDSKD